MAAVLAGWPEAQFVYVEVWPLDHENVPSAAASLSPIQSGEKVGRRLHSIHACSVASLIVASGMPRVVANPFVVVMFAVRVTT